MVHHHKSNIIWKFFTNELNELYLNNFIRTFAIGLVHAFIPLYLLHQGFALSDAIWYMFFVYLFFIFAAPFAIHVSQKIGLKHTFLVNIATTIVYFFFLQTIIEFSWPIYLLSFFYATTTAFYWMPYNTLFSLDTDKGHSGSEVGTLMALADISGLFAPLAGAFLIQTYDFLTAFIVCCVLLVISTIPLFFTPEHKLKVRHNWEKVFSMKNKTFGIKFFFEGVIGAALIAWPLFVYLFYEEYMFIGFLGVIAGVGSAIITYSLGWITDNLGEEKILRWGGFFMAIAWIVPIFAANEVVFIILSLCHGFLISLIGLPLFSQACEAGQRQGASEFMIFRETALNVGRIFALGVLLFTLDFNVFFGTAVVASLYFLLFTKG